MTPSASGLERGAIHATEERPPNQLLMLFRPSMERFATQMSEEWADSARQLSFHGRMERRAIHGQTIRGSATSHGAAS